MLYVYINMYMCVCTIAFVFLMYDVAIYDGRHTGASDANFSVISLPKSVVNDV